MKYSKETNVRVSQRKEEKWFSTAFFASFC